MIDLLVRLLQFPLQSAVDLAHLVRVFKGAYDVLYTYMIGNSRKNALYVAPPQRVLLIDGDGGCGRRRVLLIDGDGGCGRRRVLLIDGGCGCERRTAASTNNRRRWWM